MLRKSFLFLAELFLMVSLCSAQPILETENFILSIESYFRADLITYKNIIDLDSANSDDTTTYLGIDYSFGFKYDSKRQNTQYFLRLERNGPGDYDAPIFIHNTLINSGGQVTRYRNEQLLPNIEEFWVDRRFQNNLGFKTGLYTYEVGNGFSLNGSYENFGATFYKESDKFSWQIYYCRPEAVYKNPLGPRINQEREHEYLYNHNASNFFATDVKFKIGKNTFWPYVGILADYTSGGKRDNIFSAPIKKDLLGTVGFAWDLKEEKLLLKLEMARNFGKAESESSDFKDIYHTGYFIYTSLDYCIGRFTPSFAFLLASGNKVSLDDAINEKETLTSGKNRAFSSYSPLNKNLGDTISACNSEARPIVAMGSGCGLHYGIPRPATLAASDFENVILPSLGFDFDITPKLKFGLYGYYISSFEKGVGMLNNEAKRLSRELGKEIDVFIDYKISDKILVSFLGGYFWPGKFYKEQRDDASGSLLTPFVRGDRKTDPAYQIELSVEFQF
jgi:hypothetical protein